MTKQKSALGSLVSIAKGKKHDEVFDSPMDGSKRYIQIDDLRNDSNLKYTTEHGIEVGVDDVIIAWDGANAGTIGFGLSGYIGSTLARLKILDPLVFPNYLGRFLRGKSAAIRERCSGATIPHVNKSFLQSIEIPLPPLPLQKQIAAILEKADAAREKRRQANQLTEQFLQSAFLEMFGDPVTNPKGWKVVKFPEIIESGPQNGLYRPSKDYGDGIPILRIDSFHDGEVHDISDLKRVRIDLDTTNLYLLRENDIVINRVNSIRFLGKSAIIPGLPEPTVFESNMMRITLNQSLANPRFVVEMLQQNVVRNQILRNAKDAVNQSSINQEDVKSFRFPLPPLDKQQKFAALVEKVERLRAKQRESEKQLEELFNSLMQRAFKGEMEFNC